MKLKVLGLFVVLLSSTAGFAADVEVKSAWVRGTVPAQTMSGAFMEITSKRGATLIGASTPLAEDTEVHEMKMEDGVMKMRAVPRLALPAGKTVTLAPGGYHIMLMGLKKQLKPSDKVSITLKFKTAKKKIERLTINAEVRDLTDSSNSASDHAH